ncbi:hypothetical protein, partial [Sulfurimonas sp.]|uniref:hypothetical protein n=1 Tax=Sulfurimonas sp. TaxID=2022749 RepID=UPI003D110691
MIKGEGLDYFDYLLKLDDKYHIKDKKVYNMTVAEGIPHEHLLLLKLFLKKGMKLKQVVIGLDDFSFQVPFEKHQGIPDTKTHYLATNT